MNANVLAMMIWEALQDKKEVKVLTQETQEIDKIAKRYFVQISDKKYPVSKGLALGAIKHGAGLESLPKKYKINNLTFSI